MILNIASRVSSRGTCFHPAFILQRQKASATYIEAQDYPTQANRLELARFVRKALIPVLHPCEEGSCGPFCRWGYVFGTNLLLNLSSSCSSTKRQQFPGAALVLLSFSFFGTLSKGSTFSFSPSLLLSVHSPRPKANCLWASFERFSGIQRSSGEMNGSVDSLQFVAISTGYLIAQ